MPDNPVPPDYFERFVEELEGIRRSVDATAKFTEKNTDALQDLADFYQRGFSTQASRALTDPLVRELQNIQASLGQPQQFDDDLKRALSAIANQGPARGPGHLDPREAEAGGYKPSGGGSRAPSLFGLPGYVSSWREGLGSSPGVLELPRSEGARLTPQDLLNWGGDRFSGIANWQSQRVGNKAQAKIDQVRQDAFNLPYGSADYDEQIQRLYEEEQKQIQKQQSAGSVPGRVGRVLGWGASQLPSAYAVRDIAQKFGIDASPSNLTQVGAQLGRNPGGIVQVGPFGFRSPINAATLAGAKREWEIQKMRQGGGINEKQARFIFDQLNARGFSSESDQHPWQDYGGSIGHVSAVRSQMQNRPTFGAMADSMKYLTRKNPALLNEETVTLMDKAVRTGAESLAQFNKVMVDVPQVAQHAGYSMQQLQADMDAVGEAYEQIGGTHAAGQNAAKSFLGLTKTPSALLPQLMQNPWVQSAAIQHFGLMPWEQGLMSGDQWGLSTTNAMKQMYDSTAGMPSQRYNAGGGFVGTFSSKDRRLAIVAQQLGVPVNQVRQQLDNYNTIQARGQLEERAQIWSKEIGGLRGDPAKRHHLLFGTGAGTKGELLKEMQAAHFTPDEMKEVKGAIKVDPNDKHVKDMLKHGATKEQIAASQQFNKINQIINKQTDKVGSDVPRVTVELGSNAKKHGFFIQNKQKAGAGQTSTTVPFGGGPSEIPGWTPGTGIPIK